MDNSLQEQTENKPARGLLAAPVIVTAVAVVVLGLTALLLLLQWRRQAQVTSEPSGPSLVQSPVDSSNSDKASPTESLPPDTKDYSASNAVSVLLGQESEDDGVRHLPDEPDGRTTIETLEGVPCRYHNRKSDNKRFGYLYFAIHPDFKRDELKTAAIEIEYRVPSTSYIRLQYDGQEGDTHQRFKPVLPIGGEMTPGTGTRYTPIRASNQWQTATFQVTDGAFMNSQNGGADFRLEVFPPEIYVRRVSVFRPAGQRPMPETNR